MSIKILIISTMKMITNTLIMLMTISYANLKKSPYLNSICHTYFLQTTKKDRKDTSKYSLQTFFDIRDNLKFTFYMHVHSTRFSHKDKRSNEDLIHKYFAPLHLLQYKLK